MKRTIPWPPKPQKRKELSDFRLLRDGEPFGVQLQRWVGDAKIQGAQIEVCCGCGLRHLATYEMEYVGQGTFLLTKRFYRLPTPRRIRGGRASARRARSRRP